MDVNNISNMFSSHKRKVQNSHKLTISFKRNSLKIFLKCICSSIIDFLFHEKKARGRESAGEGEKER